MSKKRLARYAGMIYLVIIITGMFSLAYVPGKLIDKDNAAATFTNISSNESLFRLGIASSVICYIAFIFLPVVLHQLLKTVNGFYSKVMVLLAIISVPISLISLQYKFAVLSLVHAAKLKPVQPAEEVFQQTMQYLSQYDTGIFIATIFWGLWLLPFGYLVLKSGFLPRFLGILLMTGCFCYLINFFGHTLAANYASYGIAKYLRFPSAIAEMGSCVWLLLAGVKKNYQTPLNYQQ